MMPEESEERKEGGQILDEIEALGQELSAAVKALWESEESRKLRQDLREGFIELGRQLDTAVKSAQESEAAKEFGEQMKDTLDKARSSDLAGKLEQGLVSGLRELNQEVSKLVDSLQEKDATKTDEQVGPEA
jgi:soluble cytochrome b562